MTRRRIRSLEHYEARVEKLAAGRSRLEPRVVKSPAREIKLYTYRQLWEIASKPKASPTEKLSLDLAREWCLKGFEADFEYTLELWGSALKSIGIYDGKIQFSGFCSQGDGASFTGRFDLDKLIEFMTGPQIISPSIGSDDKGNEVFAPWVRHKLKANDQTYDLKYRRLLKIADWFDDLSIERTSSHYVHVNTCHSRISLKVGNHPAKRLEKLVAAFLVDVEELREVLCKVIYDDLEEDYNFQQSDEAFADTGDANEWWFTEGGRRYDE